MHVPPSRLIIATGNSGKLREFRLLLAGLPFEVESLVEIGAPSPEESGATFTANAILKAQYAARLSGAAAIADDSGLEVDALGGKPGIFSARYAGSNAGAAANDAANNAKLLAALASVPAHLRSARYRCALAFMAAADAEPVVAEGVWEGCILDAPRGHGGFGYDRYFWLPEMAMSVAELDPEQKNTLSHRGTAMRRLRELLDARARHGASAAHVTTARE